jgi:hypothetical protein
MNRYYFAAVLFTTVACLNLHAQTENAYASIPFDFRMGDHLMPAGNYDIHESNGSLSMHEESGRANGILLTHVVTRTVAPTKSSLVFHRYGKDYFLANYWTTVSSECLGVSVTSHEKELMSRADRGHEAIIALRQK